MKLKIRRDDASAPETNERPEMNDWFAELRHDGSAGPGRSAAGDLAGQRRVRE